MAKRAYMIGSHDDYDVNDDFEDVADLLSRIERYCLKGAEASEAQ